MSTAIEWTDATWNPVTGCTKVSPGCTHCYAERVSKRFGRDFSKVTLHPDRLKIPLRWRKPRRVFVCSMGDLFHEDVPDAFIAKTFAVMAECPWHTFQVLTKRAERMRSLVSSADLLGRVTTRVSMMRLDRNVPDVRPDWPLPNVHLGVSVENQKAADERIPLLLETPATVRFISAEPLLGPLDLGRWTHGPKTTFIPAAPGGVSYGSYQSHTPGCGPRHRCGPALDWVIVGGESGGPEKRRLVERCVCENLLRKAIQAPDGVAVCCSYCGGTFWRPKPEALEWVRSIQKQCQAAGVPFYFKQWPIPPWKPGGPALIDGHEWRQFPEVTA